MGSSSTPTPLPTLSLTAVHPRGPSRFPTITTKPCDCRKRTCKKAAKEKELKSLQDLNVYKLVPKSDVPEGQNVIGSKWVFKRKADNKFKARIVAQGWNQVHGRDCYGTYAPVCRLQSIRMVLAIAAEKNWEVIQVDVNTTFLYASFEEEEKVLVEMAPGFVQFTKDGVRYVMDLQRVFTDVLKARATGGRQSTRS